MKILSYVSKTLAIFSGALILIAALLISYSAFARYFFHASSTWENELSIYLLMGSVWLGCGPTMLANRHVSIRLLTKFGNRNLSLFLHIFSYLASISVGIVLTVKGWLVTMQAIQGDWHASTIWGPSLVVPYIIIPIGLSFFVLAAVIRLVDPGRDNERTDDSGL